MNEIIFSLCHKPVIGPIMLISSLCIFEPPIDQASVLLKDKGVILNKTFDAPVSKKYFVELNVKHTPEQADTVRALIGYRYINPDIKLDEIPPEIRPKLGVQTPLEITIYRESDNAVISNTQAVGLGRIAHTRTEVMRKLKSVELTKGRYRLVVSNHSDLSAFSNFSTSISITSGHAK